MELIRDFDIHAIVKIRPIQDDEERRWKGKGLGTGVLVLGRWHIEILCFPIHYLILQFAIAHKLYLMKLTPNSLQCLVASIILNEVKGKGITLANLLYTLQINKTPFAPSGPPQSYYTFYLTANNPSSKNFIYFLWKTSHWQRMGNHIGLFVIVGTRFLPILARKHFQPLLNSPKISIHVCSALFSPLQY